MQKTLTDQRPSHSPAALAVAGGSFMKAALLRAKFVSRMECENDKYDIPVYWRMKDGYAEFGQWANARQQYKIWTRVHPLSCLLCREHVEVRARIAVLEETGVPF